MAQDPHLDAGNALGGGDGFLIDLWTTLPDTRHVPQAPTMEVHSQPGPTSLLSGTADQAAGTQTFFEILSGTGGPGSCQMGHGPVLFDMEVHPQPGPTSLLSGTADQATGTQNFFEELSGTGGPGSCQMGHVPVLFEPTLSHNPQAQSFVTLQELQRQRSTFTGDGFHSADEGQRFADIGAATSATGLGGSGRIGVNRDQAPRARTAGIAYQSSVLQRPSEGLAAASSAAVNGNPLSEEQPRFPERYVSVGEGSYKSNLSPTSYCPFPSALRASNPTLSHNPQAQSFVTLQELQRQRSTFTGDGFHSADEGQRFADIGAATSATGLGGSGRIGVNRDQAPGVRTAGIAYQSSVLQRPSEGLAAASSAAVNGNLLSEEQPRFPERPTLSHNPQAQSFVGFQELRMPLSTFTGDGSHSADEWQRFADSGAATSATGLVGSGRVSTDYATAEMTDSGIDYSQRDARGTSQSTADNSSAESAGHGSSNSRQSRRHAMASRALTDLVGNHGSSLLGRHPGLLSDRRPTQRQRQRPRKGESRQRMKNDVFASPGKTQSPSLYAVFRALLTEPERSELHKLELEHERKARGQVISNSSSLFPRASASVQENGPSVPPDDGSWSLLSDSVFIEDPVNVVITYSGPELNCISEPHELAVRLEHPGKRDCRHNPLEKAASVFGTGGFRSGGILADFGHLTEETVVISAECRYSRKVYLTCKRAQCTAIDKLFIGTITFQRRNRQAKHAVRESTDERRSERKDIPTRGEPAYPCSEQLKDQPCVPVAGVHGQTDDGQPSDTESVCSSCQMCCSHVLSDMYVHGNNDTDISEQTDTDSMQDMYRSDIVAGTRTAWDQLLELLADDSYDFSSELDLICDNILHCYEEHKRGCCGNILTSCDSLSDPEMQHNDLIDSTNKTTSPVQEETAEASLAVSSSEVTDTQHMADVDKAGVSTM